MKDQIKSGAKFIISIGAFYTLFWIIISSLDLYTLKAFISCLSQGLLSVFGVPSIAAVIAGEPSITVGSVTAQITNLCAGDLEIALLAAIILSTFDRPLRKRLWGVFFGLILIFIANPLRIATVLAVGHYTNWVWANFTHDFLFRLMLLIIIFVYYFIWYVKYDNISRFFGRLKK